MRQIPPGPVSQAILDLDYNDMDTGDRASFTSYIGPGTIMLWTRVKQILPGPVSQAMLDMAL